MLCRTWPCLRKTNDHLSCRALGPSRARDWTLVSENVWDTEVDSEHEVCHSMFVGLLDMPAAQSVRQRNERETRFIIREHVFWFWFICVK